MSNIRHDSRSNVIKCKPCTIHLSLTLLYVFYVSIGFIQNVVTCLIKMFSKLWNKRNTCNSFLYFGVILPSLVAFVLFRDLFRDLTKMHKYIITIHTSTVSTSSTETRAVEPELKFLAPAPVPGIENFWLRLQPLKVFGFGSRTIWSNKN